MFGYHLRVACSEIELRANVQSDQYQLVSLTPITTQKQDDDSIFLLQYTVHLATNPKRLLFNKQHQKVHFFVEKNSG